MTQRRCLDLDSSLSLDTVPEGAEDPAADMTAVRAIAAVPALVPAAIIPAEADITAEAARREDGKN